MSDVRVRKLQEFIKQEVSQMLMRGLKDPRIGFTTVTDVHVTGDLREATIYVSLFGSDKEKEDTLIALKTCSWSCAYRAWQGIEITPYSNDSFDKDTSLDYSMHIESLLNEIKRMKKQINKKDTDYE